MNRLGLRPADTGGNVLIGQPFDPVVFDRTEQDEGISYARVTQVAADLMTGPGRGPAEAEGLVKWMEANEEVWRLPSTPNYVGGQIRPAGCSGGAGSPSGGGRAGGRPGDLRVHPRPCRVITRFLRSRSTRTWR